MMRGARKRHLGLPLLGGVLLGFTVMGCVAQNAFQPPRRDEIPDGPGLFTGSKGAWVISRNFGPRQAQTEAAGTQVVEPPAPRAKPSESPSVPTSVPEATPSAPATPKHKAPPL